MPIFASSNAWIRAKYSVLMLTISLAHVARKKHQLQLMRADAYEIVTAAMIRNLKFCKVGAARYRLLYAVAATISKYSQVPSQKRLNKLVIH